jgi:hypothetical protein
VGHRLDGWPNRDLNVGAIIALAPDLSAVANLLSTTQMTVRTVLNTWGPGKFDAELFLDGKASNPQQVTDGSVTGTNVPGATLIPPAFGLGGVNLHTWTGWGSVPHWNAFVANLEMHGQGRFWDPRLDTPQFPIAATHGFGDLRLPNGQYISPDDDQITSKLQALQFYQLAIPSPQPPSGSFDPAAADRGDTLFSGRPSATTVTSNPSGQIRVGTCTRPPKFASTAFKPIARRIIDIELRPSAICSRTRKAVFITMDDSLPWRTSSIITTPARRWA